MKFYYFFHCEFHLTSQAEDTGEQAVGCVQFSRVTDVRYNVVLSVQLAQKHAI